MSLAEAVARLFTGSADPLPDLETRLVDARREEAAAREALGAAWLDVAADQPGAAKVRDKAASAHASARAALLGLEDAVEAMKAARWRAQEAAQAADTARRWADTHAALARRTAAVQQLQDALLAACAAHKDVIAAGEEARAVAPRTTYVSDWSLAGAVQRLLAGHSDGVLARLPGIETAHEIRSGRTLVDLANDQAASGVLAGQLA